MSFKQTFFPLTATDFSDTSTAERQTSESRILDKEKLSLYNYKRYYFINEFEESGLIEPPPYDPTREGYEFAGWYKEPECVNMWDFETDTLPEAEYDDAGEAIYRETRLYAKWNKIM